MDKKDRPPEPTGAFKDARVIHTLPWSSEALTSVAFISNDRVAAGNKRGDILIWDLSAPQGQTPDPVRRLAGHTNEINRILVTPDGKTLISASSDRTVRYWDAQSDEGEPGTVILNDGIVRKGVIPLVAKLPETPPPIEVKVVVEKPIRSLTGHQDWVVSLTQTPDGKTLVTGDDKGVVIVWDLPDGKEKRRWQAKYWARSLDVSPDGKTVAVSEYVCLRHPEKEKDPYCAFRLWDVESGKPRADLSKDIKDAMAAVAYSADGKWLAVGVGGGVGPEQKGTVTLLDPATGRKIRELTPHHELGATDLAFHPDGKHLFSSGRDQHVKIWRLEDGQHVRNLGTPKKRGDWISSISISLDGRRLAAADMSGKVVVYSLTGDPLAAREATAPSPGPAPDR
jgi:WD40 repeat protein